MPKRSVEERVERFKAFFERKNEDGPLVGFYFDSYYPLHRYEAAARLPHGTYTAADLHPEDYLVDYESLYSLYEECPGDFIWTASAFWGVPWMEALVGCEIVADHETGSSRSLPRHDVRTADDLPDFNLQNPWVQKARAFLEGINTISGGRFPAGTTLMRGFSDVLAAIFGNPAFIYKLIDDQDKMSGIIEKIGDIWIAFAEAQLDLIPDFYSGVGSFFYDVWMPGRSVWLQEDAAALLSPPLFERYILPGIQRIATHFDTSIIHLHPTQYIPVNSLLKTDLSAIELHIDYGGPSAEDLYPYYKKIQEQKPLIIWGDLSRDDVAFIADHLDPRGLAVKVVVKDCEEAAWVAETLEPKG